MHFSGCQTSTVYLGFYYFDKTLWPKAAQGGKGLFHLTASSPSSRGVRVAMQNRILEAGTEVKAMEESCSLVCSLEFAQPAFLNHPGASLLKVRPFHINH